MKSMLLQRIRLLYVSGFVVSAVFMASCSDDDTDKNAVYDPNKPVVLESYSPQEGGVGTKLIIRGENFGYDPSKVKVRIANDENREARVVSAKGNRIYAIVPARADTGKVTVTIGEGEEAQEVAFEEEFQYEFKKNLSTLCGGGFNAEDKDGTFKEAKFARPLRLALDNENQKLYVLEADAYKCIREVDLINEKVSTPWRAPGLHNLRTISFGTSCDTLFVGVEGSSSNVSTVFLLRSDGFVRHKTYAPRSGSNASILNPVDGELFINDYYKGMVLRWDRDKQEMVELVQCFNNNTDFTYCWSHDGKYLYALALGGASHSAIVRMEYDFATKTLGEPNTWVGMDGQLGYQDGVGEDARINQPYQMCTGPQGDFFLADPWNHCIRRIVDNAGTATVTTYAGIGGQLGFTEGDPLEAQLQFPTGVAVSDDGSTVYVADKENNRICKITVE